MNASREVTNERRFVKGINGRMYDRDMHPKTLAAQRQFEQTQQRSRERRLVQKNK